MKYLSTLIALMMLATPVLAQTQPPASLSGYLLDADTRVYLGAQLSWGAVSGATYKLYSKVFQYKQNCTQVVNWNLEQSGITTNTYEYDLQASDVDTYGWGGYWCFGVSAVVNGSESTITSLPQYPGAIAMGSKWYVLWFYDLPDCSARLTGTNPPAPGTLVITRTQDGETVTLPYQMGLANPYRFAGFARFKSTAVVAVQLTLPDGTRLNYPNVFVVAGVPLPSEAAPYLELDLASASGNGSGGDRLCNAQTWTYPQQSSSNLGSGTP